MGVGTHPLISLPHILPFKFLLQPSLATSLCILSRRTVNMSEDRELMARISQLAGEPGCASCIQHSLIWLQVTSTCTKPESLLSSDQAMMLLSHILDLVMVLVA